MPPESTRQLVVDLENVEEDLAFAALNKQHKFREMRRKRIYIGPFDESDDEEEEKEEKKAIIELAPSQPSRANYYKSEEVDLDKYFALEGALKDVQQTIRNVQTQNQ